MGSRFQVKMEYPFPANNNAQLVWAWNDAANQIQPWDEDELNEQVSECLSEADIITCDQSQLVLECMADLTDCIGDPTVPYTTSVLKSWHLIMELSNYIRCCSGMADVDGEMYGLKVLMDFMAGEDYV